MVSVRPATGPAVLDYAQRKGWTVEEAERWLAPVLNYDPAPADVETAAA